MTIKEIQHIIKEFEASTLTHLELEMKDVKIKLSKNKNNEIIEENIETNQHKPSQVAQAETPLPLYS